MTPTPDAPAAAAADAATGAGWLARRRGALARVALAPVAQAIGRVERVADGIAFVSGLEDTMLNEVLRFEGGVTGFAHTLDEDLISVVLLDPDAGVRAQTAVARTGAVLEVPAGPQLLGRVVDPLGRPLDGGAPLDAAHTLPIERAAPAIIERDLVSEPLDTGVLIVDALFTIGRGQRELIIGDRATGKTSLAIDAIVNQRHSDVICVYVAIGQRASAVRRVIDAVRRYGAPERCVFVVAPAACAPGLQWIAPFAGFSIAEYFRDRGQHALVVVDDLTKHAATHRELALLTREPPGREAYPGDIFYVHARLLERAAKLSAALGGGSLSALPIAETDAGNLAAYIPTNLISITDGQIVLDSALFAANQRPAVDVGLSVSRVGGKAQHPALRAASGRLRLDYAQFLELEAFTRFGGLTDARLRAQITRGERIRALITQPRFRALRTLDEVVLLKALAAGALDAMSPDLVAPLRERLPAWLDARIAALTPALAPPRDWLADDAALDALAESVDELIERIAADAAHRATAGMPAEDAAGDIGGAFGGEQARGDADRDADHGANREVSREVSPEASREVSREVSCEVSHEADRDAAADAARVAGRAPGRAEPDRAAPRAMPDGPPRAQADGDRASASRPRPDARGDAARTAPSPQGGADANVDAEAEARHKR
ncbi:F0F1 ATP synthase subunit alpha [Burkholderia pseudomallei 1258b]|uniref:F0F1 ATP synthase subunit alpha n=1 Tax=Burkholderia pseudomallei TaxID=28450 RepID=UPI00025C3351|nr:F0F1 ATP synthase subunit alpha [Burkholderia pseudomallei]EIF55797.1 F0F1 ATP synthase subunit alpha [Burkholderia pseudomallei 1258b]